MTLRRLKLTPEKECATLSFLCHETVSINKIKFQEAKALSGLREPVERDLTVVHTSTLTCHINHFSEEAAFIVFLCMKRDIPTSPESVVSTKQNRL